MKKEVLILLEVFLALNFVISQNYAPGEVIVKYKDNVIGLGNKVIVNNKLIIYEDVDKPIEKEKIVDDYQIYNLKFEENSDVFSIAEKYRKMKEVEYAEPNFIMESFFVPNDTNYNLLYWTKNINVENAWNLTKGSKNIKIAILDTGVDWNHPDLSENIWNSTDSCTTSLDINNNGYKGDCRGYDFTDINVTNYINAGYTLVEGEDYNTIDNDPMDFEGHGTHVAGIAGAVGNNNLGVVGVCLNCSIMPIRSGFNIITSSGSSIGSLEVDDVVSAIYYAADNSADVISMSFGGIDSESVRTAIEYAYNKGSILVSSAGNYGSNNKQYPCGYDKVICVASINSDDSASGYSNYGDWVKLAAPGTGILSTNFDDDYTYLSGTSMSAPMVSGIIGLIKSIFDKNQTEILKSLRDTGTPINFSGTIINRTDAYSAILSLDNISPYVNLVSPSNNIINSSLNQIFICNASDWQLKDVSLKIWNNTNLFYTKTKNISGIYNSSTFEVELANDSYKWNCLVSDINNNKAYAIENFSISTIFVEEKITINYPENNSYINSNPNNFSCSIQVSNDKKIENMTFSLWNVSKLIYNETKILTGTSNSTNFSYSFSDDGTYYWNCKSYTDSNQVLITNNFTIIYDATNPVINLLKPENEKSYDSNSQEIEFNFSVSEYSDCDLFVDDNLELELNNIINGSFKKTFTPASYSWKVICEDDSKNFRESETRSFSVNKISNGNGGEVGTTPVSGGSSGSSGGSGSGGGGSIVSPSQNQQNSNENEGKENIEGNEEELKKDSQKSDITGFSVDATNFALNNIQKYKNRINIFIVGILLAIISLFYLDLKYEKKIMEEIELLERE